MKKLLLQKVHQKGVDFFLLVADPRVLVSIINFPGPGELQETQRPWSEPRVKDLAKYIAGKSPIGRMKDKIVNHEIKAKGIIPNLPILNILNPLDIIEDNGSYYLLFPETEEEFKQAFGAIQPMDGQHRCISFLDKYRDPDFKDAETYQMGFVLFKELNTSLKREIFTVTNYLVVKVEDNVLRRIMKWLKILIPLEEHLYDITVLLNEEDESPLKGRISIGGSKVKNGYKLVQITRLLQTSKTWEILEQLPEENRYPVIVSYLKAWQKAYPEAFNSNRHVLSKIAGLRYILFLFPYVWQIAKDQKFKLYDVEKTENIIRKLKTIELLDEDFFANKEAMLLFRAETSTIALAKKHGNLLETLHDDFIPA